jgi:hypothetical protein
MPGIARQCSLSFRGFADRLSEQRRYGDEPEHNEHEAREARSHGLQHGITQRADFDAGQAGA